jgi:hypothetical protein
VVFSGAVLSVSVLSVSVLSGVVLSVREIPADHCPMPLCIRFAAGDGATLSVCVRLMVTFGAENDMQRIVDIPKGQVPTVSL